MNDSSLPTHTLRTVAAISEIGAAEWDACANPPQAAAPPSCDPHPSLQEDLDNPFISHAFLSALEASGSVGGRTGWRPAHLVLRDAAGAVAGVAPSYLKSHSQGEYVFDHAFADALERAGGRYYPKVQVAVPFTPATGRRLLAGDGPHAEAIRQRLARGLLALRDQIGASSVHVTFLTEAEQAALAATGWLARDDIQFHWLNEGYGSYEDFLGALASRKRKGLRRERREALSAGISVEVLTGSDLTERVWDDFFAFYMDTGGRKWGRPYLTRAFYSEIGARMPDRIVLMMAKRAGRYIAGAINFRGRNTLYGRHWGCIEDHPFLHFELCYHQAIDYAIAHGLDRVEAGAQGEHKLSRGYRPVLTRSAHHMAHPGLQDGVRRFLRDERRHIAAAREALEAELPFRAAQDAPEDAPGERAG